MLDLLRKRLAQSLHARLAFTDRLAVLVSGIITADAHIVLSRVPLTVSARRVADPV